MRFHKLFIFSIVAAQSLFLTAQVGINKQNPNATLDLNGDLLVQGKLYLENPGKYSGESDSKMLVINNNSVVAKYDINASAYGPINYVQFVFNEVSSNGLSAGFDTKIKASDYTLAVHGFSFTTNTGGTGATNRKTSGTPTLNRDRYIEGQQFYAYIDGTGENRTWRLRGFVNNSPFYNVNTATRVNIKMDVVIYRNDFITKIWNDTQEVDMNNLESGNGPIIGGF